MVNDAGLDLSFFVLRDFKVLRKINQVLLSNKLEICESLKSEIIKVNHCSALLPVRLEIVGKGTLAPNSMISWPSETDMNSFRTKNIGEISNCSANTIRMEKSDMRPKETLQTDTNVAPRKVLKAKHLLEKRHFQKKCKEIKKKIINLKASANFDCTTNCKQKDASIANEIKHLSKSLDDMRKKRLENNQAYTKNIKSLWGLETSDFDNVRYSCSRQILGYLTMSGQSLRLGSKSVGLGYVSLSGMWDYICHYIKDERHHNMWSPKLKSGGVCVLVRTPDSVHYSYARLNVLEK